MRVVPLNRRASKPGDGTNEFIVLGCRFFFVVVVVRSCVC